MLLSGFVKAILSFVFAAWVVSGALCLAGGDETAELRHYDLNNIPEVPPAFEMFPDSEVTADGQGSLRIETTTSVTVPLFSTGALGVDNATLLYQAKLRTKDLQGYAFLEMLCEFKGKGVFFSRAQQSALSGNSDWVLQQTPFFLKKGEQPGNVQLNLVITGKGTVWVDDVRLLKGPLQ